MKDKTNLTNWNRLKNLEFIQGIPEEITAFHTEVFSILRYMRDTGDITHKRALVELVGRQEAFLNRTVGIKEPMVKLTDTQQ